MIDRPWLLTAATTCLLLAFASLPLAYLPTSAAERRLWRVLGVRRWRHWATARATERTPPASGALSDIARKSRRNILWHGALMAAFASLMFQAQRSELGVVRIGSLVLLVPAVAYLLGSIVQRQKLAVIERRGRRRRQR